MSLFESIRASTGLDQFFLANALFFAMVVLIWLAIVILEQRDRRPLPPQARSSGRAAPLTAFAPKFANGWICRACWTSNRVRDLTCPRCGRGDPSLPPEPSHRSEGDLRFSFVGAPQVADPADSSASRTEAIVSSELAGKRGTPGLRS